MRVVFERKRKIKEKEEGSTAVSGCLGETVLTPFCDFWAVNGKVLREKDYRKIGEGKERGWWGAE